jgi:hypothetical protein
MPLSGGTLTRNFNTELSYHAEFEDYRQNNFCNSNIGLFYNQSVALIFGKHNEKSIASVSPHTPTQSISFIVGDPSDQKWFVLHNF